jgi:hypothetical protein
VRSAWGDAVVVAALVSFDHDVGADLVGFGDGVEDRQADAGEGVDVLLLRVDEPCGTGPGAVDLRVEGEVRVEHAGERAVVALLKGLVEAVHEVGVGSGGHVIGSFSVVPARRRGRREGLFPGAGLGGWGAPPPARGPGS